MMCILAHVEEDFFNLGMDSHIPFVDVDFPCLTFISSLVHMHFFARHVT